MALTCRAPMALARLLHNPMALARLLHNPATTVCGLGSGRGLSQGRSQLERRGGQRQRQAKTCCNDLKQVRAASLLQTGPERSGAQPLPKEQVSNLVYSLTPWEFGIVYACYLSLSQ